MAMGFCFAFAKREFRSISAITRFEVVRILRALVSSPEAFIPKKAQAYFKMKQYRRSG
jgi:hypothetical protein